MSEEDSRPTAVVMAGEKEESVILTTERRFKRGNADDYKLVERKREEVNVGVFSGPVAEVTRSYGFTINLGNYESARFDIALKVPCELEDVEAADEFAKKFISERIKIEWTALKPGAKED